LKNH